MSINYSMIPAHCRAGMKRYIEQGVIPGDFLQAVVENDLVHSFGLADNVNMTHLKDYANFLYNEAPFQSWGSKEIMHAWAKAKGK